MLLLIFLSSKLTFFWLRVNIALFLVPCVYWWCELVFNFWLYLVRDICDLFCQIIGKLAEIISFYFTLISGGFTLKFLCSDPTFHLLPLSAVKIDQKLLCSVFE